MSSYKTKLKCGKCGNIYYHEENLGTLKCFDVYYTADLKNSFKVRADHRQIRHAKDKYNMYDWMRWVWTMDDCIFVEKNRLKKIYPQPDRLSVVDIDEFNHKHQMYINGSIEDDIEQNKKKVQMFVKREDIRFDADDLEDYNYDSQDDDIDSESSEEEDISITDGVIKQVCIARFDWREKFKVLLQIKKIDNQIDAKEFRPMQLFPYYETIEYKSSDSVKRTYFEHGLH